jgi:threonine synthase
MGLPVSRLVAATNANDVLPDYLSSGTYRPRASVATLSNAMDVGDPSNFARLAAMFDSSAARMREQIAGMRVSEADTRAAIRDAYRRSGVILDPHAAVAYCAALRFRHDAGTRAPMVVLATAHPAKFSELIREELGVEPELPASERDWRSRLLLSVDLPDVSAASLAELLCNLPAAPAV